MVEQTKQQIEIKQINEINNLQKDVVDANLNNLEKKTENSEVLPTTYDILQGTKMYASVEQKIGKEKAVEFAKNIERPVRLYLEQELSGINPQIINSMIIAIQFSMMEQLAKEGQENMAGIFDKFGGMYDQKKETSKDKTGKLEIQNVFKGMFGFFSNSGVFLDLAKKVDNFTTFLKGQKDNLQGDIPKLTNPLECKTLLNNDMWNTPIEDTKAQEKLNEIKAITTIDADWKTKLQNIANSDKLIMTEKMIQSLEKASLSAENFLKKRTGYKEKITKFLTKGQNIFDFSIDVPLLGSVSLGGMLGIKKGGTILDMFKKDGTVGKVVDFILKILGLGGLDGYKKEVVKEKLKGSITDDGKGFITSVLKEYKTVSPTQNIPESETTLAVLGLQNDKTAATYKDKIPNNYKLIKEQMIKNIGTTPEKIICLETAEKYKLNVEKTKDKDGKETLTNIKDFNAENFSKAYLDDKIKELIKNDDFMKKIAESQNPQEEFLLGLMGGVVAGEYFFRGVELGLQSASMYVSVPQTPTTSQTTTPETNNQSQTTGEKISDNKQFLMLVREAITRQESGNLYWAVNPYDVNGVSLGLIQWHGDNAKKLVKKLQQADPTKFNAIMGPEFANLDTPSLWNQRRYDDKIKKFENLMQEQVFKNTMNDVLEDDIKGYIKNLQARGITDKKALVVACRLYNAGMGRFKDSILDPMKSRGEALTAENIIKQFKTTGYVRQYPGTDKKADEMYAWLQNKNIDATVDVSNIA